MENLQFSTWQTAALAVLYAAYLCWVMFGGLRDRVIKPRVYVIMTALLIYGVVEEFTGVRSAAEAANIGIVLAVGFVKGIVLGRRKIVRKVDGLWRMRHDGRYIVIWVAFFAAKLALTQALGLLSGASFPAWHIILYFCFYYPWRTVNVFVCNPEMQKEVLSRG